MTVYNVTKDEEGRWVIERPTDKAGAIPNWATWNEAEVLAWVDANAGDLLPVGSLAEANVVLGNVEAWMRAMSRMIVALRDTNYPGLSE